MQPWPLGPLHQGRNAHADCRHANRTSPSRTSSTRPPLSTLCPASARAACSSRSPALSSYVPPAPLVPWWLVARREGLAHATSRDETTLAAGLATRKRQPDGTQSCCLLSLLRILLFGPTLEETKRKAPEHANTHVPSRSMETRTSHSSSPRRSTCRRSPAPAASTFRTTSSS